MTTIFARASELTSLVAAAREAGEGGHRESAIEAVRELLTQAGEGVGAYGVAQARWRSQLDAATDAAIAAAASHVAAVVAPLGAMGDVELAAIGEHRADQRGRLAELKLATEALVRALDDAQRLLLGGWREQLWPADLQPRLAVLARLPGSQRAAERLGLAVQRLRVAESRAQSSADLETLEAAVGEAEPLARELEAAALPEDVLAFWQAAHEAQARGGGLSLAELTPEVLRWLHDNGAADELTVSLGSERRADA